MPDHVRVATPRSRVRVAGLAADHGVDGCLPVLDALRDARTEPGELAAIIAVSTQATAAVIGAGLGIAGARTFDMVDDGCGVPSSIALGGSVATQWGGAVLVAVPNGVMILRDGIGGPGESIPGSVDGSTPVVAVASDVMAVRRACGGRPPALIATDPVDGLTRARAEGLVEVVLMTAAADGRTAAVTCSLDGGSARDQVLPGRPGQRQ